MTKDEKIVEVKCGQNHTMIFKRDGEVLGFRLNNLGQIGIPKTQSRLLLPQTLMKDYSISILLSGKKMLEEWNKENHRFFNKRFREIVFTLFLCLQRIKTQTGLKIPKVLIFLFIKKIGGNSKRKHVLPNEENNKNCVVF